MPMTDDRALNQTTEQREWAAWRAELITVADKAGWPVAHVEADAYRAYFDDGYSPQDAWDEDMQHAE